MMNSIGLVSDLSDIRCLGHEKFTCKFDAHPWFLLKQKRSRKKERHLL